MSITNAVWRARVTGTGVRAAFIAAVPGAGSSGTTDHAALSNLGYASSGHTGFAGTDVANTFALTQRFGDVANSVDIDGANWSIDFRDGGGVAAGVGWSTANGYVYFENSFYRAFLRNDGYFESPVGFVTAGAVIAGQGVINTSGNTTVGLAVRQKSSSQSARLLELTDSAGSTVLAGFSADCTNLHMPNGFSVGNLATANSNHAVAIGNQANAASQSVGIGLFANSSGGNSVSVGALATSSGGSSIAIGVLSSATSTNAIAIGNSAACSQANSAVIGAGKNLAADELVWGNQQGLGAVAHFRVTGHSQSTARSMWHVTSEWVDSTDASHTVRIKFRLNDFNNLVTGQEVIAMETDGTVPKFGAFGATPVGRQGVNGLLTGDELTLAVLQALNNIGWTETV